MPDFSYQPWIFGKDCEVTEDSPFTVDCQIRPEAKWSDGVPITSNDFKFTFDTIMNTKNDVVTRDGYDKITAFNVLSPTEFQMVVPGGVRARSASCGPAPARPSSLRTSSRARTSTRSGTTASATPRRRSRSAAAR